MNSKAFSAFSLAMAIGSPPWIQGRWMVPAVPNGSTPLPQNVCQYADREAHLVLHPLAQDRPVLLVVAERERILAVRPLELDGRDIREVARHVLSLQSFYRG